MHSACAEPVFRLARDGTRSPASRSLIDETPVAFEYDGLAYAVMMASAADLDDFATGFSLSEGIIAAPEDIRTLDIAPLENGVLLRMQLKAGLSDSIRARARIRVSEGSCGLCGMDSIEEVLKPLPPLNPARLPSHDVLFAALDALSRHQPLNALTGAAHAAAFCDFAGSIVTAREDVGRHNALDKLIGALARSGQSPEQGFMLLTARCSHELVQKTIRAHCPLLVTVSAPTDLAVRSARAHGLTLIALARPDSMLILHEAAPAITEGV